MSLDWPPQKTPWLPLPPHFEKVLSMAAERGEILNTLTFLIARGASLGLLTFFWNQSLTGQHLANSGEAQLKKSPCMYPDMGVSGCVLYSSKICDEFFMINDDCQWTKIFYSLLHPSSVVIAGRLGPAWVQRRIQLTARPRDPALKCPGLWNYTRLFESLGRNCLVSGIIVRHKDQLSWP